MTGCKRGNWSTQELDRLKLLFPRSSEDRVAELLGRSVQSVRRRARELFQRSTKRGAWANDEEQQLRISHGVLNLQAMSLVLARSERDVAARIAQLRRSRRRGDWARSEKMLLKRLHGSRSDAALEVCLSRPRGQIRKMAAQLSLSKDKRLNAGKGDEARPQVRMPRWTAKEIKRLTALYPDYENLDIAQELGRSVASVANKASQLHLRKGLRVLREMGRRNVAVRYER